MKYKIAVLLLATAFLTNAQTPKSQPAQGTDAITLAKALIDHDMPQFS
jgi:hypothetical protein